MHIYIYTYMHINTYIRMRRSNQSGQACGETQGQKDAKPHFRRDVGS